MSENSFEKGEMIVSKFDETLLLDDNTVKIAAGRYVLGDPANILASDPNAWRDWYENSDLIDGPKNWDVNAANVNGYPVVGFSVSDDNRMLEDNTGASHFSKSGYFGYAPVELLEKMGVDYTASDLSLTVVKISRGTTAYINVVSDDNNVNRGELHIGNGLEISTKFD